MEGKVLERKLGSKWEFEQSGWLALWCGRHLTGVLKRHPQARGQEMREQGRRKDKLGKEDASQKGEKGRVHRALGKVCSHSL